VIDLMLRLMNFPQAERLQAHMQVTIDPTIMGIT
jgi:hypothetical protein